MIFGLIKSHPTPYGAQAILSDDLKSRSRLSWLLILWLGITAVHAGAVTETPVKKVDISQGIQILEDPEGKLVLYEILTDTQDWQLPADSGIGIGFSNSAWWFRFSLMNPHLQTDWLLQLAYPILDYVDFYVLQKGRVVAQWDVGDMRPFSNRPRRHHHFLFPLEISQSESVQIYLRVQTETSVQIPMTLWNPSDFQIYQDDSQLWHGLFYGGLLIIAAYNLLLYLGLRDPAYLFYVGYVLSLSLFMASLEGWLNVYLWPQPNNIANNAMLISLSTAITFAALFVRAFLYSHYPVSTGFLRLHWGNVILSVVFTVLSIFLVYSTVVLWLLLFAIYACCFGLAVGVVAIFQNRPSAHYYLLAWALLLGSGIILTLDKMGIIQSTVISENAIRIGALLEVLFLSFALAERINRERTLRLSAQNESIQIQLEANKALEQRVKERTLELEQVNQKLKEMSDTDLLTGLKNRRYLNGYLEYEFSRSSRYQHSLSILMVDIDHFKSINDNYGHVVGDLCLERMAKIFREAVRHPADLCSRYGGEEFCIVLPETELSGAEKVAERLLRMVENAEIQTADTCLHVTCSVGLFCDVPTVDSTINQFIDFADAALYQAKRNGRNQSVVYRLGMA